MKLKKPFIAVAAMVTVAAVSISATIAFLSDTSATVKNVFTIGKVGIILDETDLDAEVEGTRNAEGNDYKMIPGNEYTKDPMVTVADDSEDCWLFVKVEEVNEAGTYINYAISDAWTQLTDANGVAVDGVYYYNGNDSTAKAGDEIFIIENNTIVINEETVDSEYIAGLTEETQPELKFTAYAVQKENIESAQDAWAKI